MTVTATSEETLEGEPDTRNPRVFAFRRVPGTDRVRVVVNLSAQLVHVSLLGAGRVALAPWGWQID
jgi:hypothetical protein